MDHIILRKWTGSIRTADEAEYVRYVEETGGDDYSGTPGNQGFQILLRALGDGTSEVTTLSWWDSMEAVRAFAGEEAERARYYPEDDRFLLSRPEGVEHFRVVKRVCRSTSAVIPAKAGITINHEPVAG